MAGMYPDNQDMTIFGEKVQWPGVDASGKFTNGSFSDPLIKPSFIPAETLNLILDNLGELIKKLGEIPNNATIDQLAKLFTSAPSANKAIMRDAHGRAKVAAPEADDDIARKSDFQKYVDQKFIEYYKKGYLQLPGMPSPLEDSSMHYAGYSWHEVNFDGNFFRAKGRDAKSFSAKKLTTEQIKNGSYIFQDDEQGDTIRNISALSGSYMAFRDKYPGTDGQGAFFRDWTYAIGAGGPSTTDNIHLGILGFLASRAVPTANENRPHNLTVVYWVLVKNE